MRLTAFRSGKGDCLLLEGESGGRILVDGGMRDPYRAHVAPALAKLRAAGKKLDLIYISHIDEDHIAGILELLNVEMSWRVYEHQIATDNPDHPVPHFARPPKVGKIWHNAFHEQLAEDPGVIEDTLAAMASVLSGALDPALLQAAATQAELATQRHAGDPGVAPDRRQAAGHPAQSRRRRQAHDAARGADANPHRFVAPHRPRADWSAPAQAPQRVEGRGSMATPTICRRFARTPRKTRIFSGTTTSDDFARTWLAPPRNWAVPAASRRPTSRR